MEDLLKGIEQLKKRGITLRTIVKIVKDYYREMDYEERKDELWLEEKEVC